jgi:hypothetical protein
MKTYIFDVKFKHRKGFACKIELRDRQTLAELNNAIQATIRWDNDHLYSFFLKPLPTDIGFIRTKLGDRYGMNSNIARKFKIRIKEVVKNRLKREKIEYGCPGDLQEYQKSAKISLSKLGLSKGQKFEYLFDYGDCHEFVIRVVGEGKEELGVRYPHLLERLGKAPAQYSLA